MAYFMIIHTLYWFCGVFIYGSVASSHRGFNASLGNAYMLNNVDFDGPPMVYTTGLITIRGIIYYIDCLSCICQWRGGADEEGSSVPSQVIMGWKTDLKFFDLQNSIDREV